MKGITNAVPSVPDAYVDAAYSNETLTLTKASGGKTELAIEGGGVQFTLKVTYSGASDCSGIAVAATPADSTKPTATGTTNSAGIAYLTVKQNATYTITSSKSGYSFDSTPEVTCSELTTEASIGCYMPGVVTVTVTDSKSTAIRTVTATCSGQTTQKKTVTPGNSVAFSLPAGTWTFSVDYPSGASGGESKSVTVANNGTYSVTLNVIYNLVYGAAISISTADPASRVTYPATILGGITNNAHGFKPCTNASNTFLINGWDGCQLISGIKRQLCTGSKSAGWTWTDVTDKRAATAGSSSSEVYTYFPTWYFKMNLEGTDSLEFAFSMEKLDGFYDYAGSVGSDRKGHFRLGDFCSPSSSAVLSYGGMNSAAITLTNAITYTQTDKGTGWDLMTWYQWTYIAALMTLMFKTTDLQAALGNGISSSSQGTQTALTYTNDYGMYGDTSGTTTQVAFFWLQNIYGNYWQWCGGAKTDSNRRLMTCTGYSSTTDSAFDKTQLSPSFSSDLSGAIKTVVGTTDAGFFPTDCTGSYTTYFADYGYVSASAFPFVGGYCNGGTYCGPFYASFSTDAGDANAVRPSYRL